MLPKIATIIYACDLDTNTQAAMELVMNLALQNQAKVIVLHAMEPISAQAEGMINSYLSSETIQGLRAETRKATQAKMDQYIDVFLEQHQAELQALNSKPQGLLVSASPHDAIQTIAKEHKANLIVMNSRTHSKLGQMLIGSTANKVIHQSDIPVLVVPIK